MYIAYNRLFIEFQKYNEIIIWGAGKFANETYHRMKIDGLSGKIRSFVVTSITEAANIDGIPIISIAELKNIDEKCVILIAVLQQEYLTEIYDEIKYRKFRNVINLKDYCIAIRDERRFLWEESFDGMLDYIAEGYIEHYKEKELRFIDVKRKLQLLSDERKCENEKEIVFIVGVIYVRTPKLAVALKKKGYTIKILQINSAPEYAGDAILACNGIEVIKCDNLAELLYKALQEKPIVYYIDPPWQDPSLAMFMIYNKKNFGKIIFGEYDLRRSFMAVPEYFNIAEQYALENADGVVWRYDAQHYMEEEYGYHYRGKSIQFYDYCEDIQLQNERDNDGILKLCMLPTHLQDYLTKVDIDDKYTHDADLYEILELIKNRNDCSLDIYVWSYLEENLEICKNIEKNYQNVRFHFRINHSELIKELSRYDYGVHLFKESSKPIYIDTLKMGLKKSKFASENQYRYGVCNKYFDYLAAGLPVIAHLPKCQIDYMDQFGIAVKMSVDNFDIEYLKKNKSIYQENVKKALPQLLIDNQIQRLINFIETVGKK